MTGAARPGMTGAASPSMTGAARDGHRCGPPGRRGLAWLLDTVAMDTAEPGARWPEHLPVGALRVVRWSANYDQTVSFYRDTIGLAVLETFQASYGLDGTILGLPGGPVHLEIVRLGDSAPPVRPVRDGQPGTSARCPGRRRIVNRAFAPSTRRAPDPGHGRVPRRSPQAGA